MVRMPDKMILGLKMFNICINNINRKKKYKALFRLNTGFRPYENIQEGVLKQKQL